MLTKNEDSQSPTITEDPLKDKVVLLLDATNLSGRSLAVSLAKHGADIALVYRQAHAGQAQKMKNLVKAEGRRCLIIQAQNNDGTFSREVVQKTINALGRLDIFIDYSSVPRDQLGPVKDADIMELRDSLEQSGPFTNVEVLSAVFDQMVAPDRVNKQDEN